MTKPYETPQVVTLPASEIIESLGPVSCGSVIPDPISGGGGGNYLNPVGRGARGGRRGAGL